MRGRKKGVVCPKLIRKAIALAGSQSALARAIRITRQTVSTWVTGVSRPSKPCYRKLVKFTGSQDGVTVRS